MSYSLFISIDQLPKTRNTIGERRWTRHKEKNKWLMLVCHAIGNEKPDTPLKKAEIKLTRYSSKTPDFDGLVSSFKYVIDALVSLDILVDDNMNVLPTPIYKWVKAKPKDGLITVEVLECSPMEETQP